MFFWIGSFLAGMTIGFIAGCYWIDYKNDGDKKRRCLSCKYFERARGTDIHCSKLGYGTYHIPDVCGLYEYKEVKDDEN